MWKDMITQDQKDKATIYRMVQIMSGRLTEGATDYEAMLWLMTASLAAPLDRNARKIYAYLFRKVFPDKVNDVFDSHEGVFLDKHFEEPLLRRLKMSIFKSQLDHLKAKRKMTDKEIKEKLKPKNRTEKTTLM
ncbi:unnamed protein product [marine sediment metagenome]|uniref:Uncharacterized protein n=1 Tax=marine sediment metagenome TaxID=412755 RepID=X0ZVZ2_9ZZZZ